MCLVCLSLTGEAIKLLDSWNGRIAAEQVKRGKPEASQATRPRAIPLTHWAGWLLYIGAFFLGGMGLAAAGISRFIAFGGTAGVSLFFLLAGLCLLLFCGYQFHRLWAESSGAVAASMAPGEVLAWELPRDRLERLGLTVIALFALLWNGASPCSAEGEILGISEAPGRLLGDAGQAAGHFFS
jgi:hypothetical protein